MTKRVYKDKAILIRVPQTLIMRLDKAASDEHRSRSGLIRHLLENSLAEAKKSDAPGAK
jgi:metal-responsive CopG/Arc/MetJ family transcriptional regulator